jgi:hypothetical protein
MAGIMRSTTSIPNGTSRSKLSTMLRSKYVAAPSQSLIPPIGDCHGVVVHSFQSTPKLNNLGIGIVGKTRQ